MSQIKHKVLSGEQFGELIGEIRGSAQALWAKITTAVVDVVLHYHQNSYDTSRPKRLYEVLNEANLGSMETAFTQVLRQATGITGIGVGGAWKHNAKILEDKETIWEEVLERVETDGLGAFKPERTAQVKKVNQKAKTSVKLGDAVSDEVRNAMQVMVDKLPKDPEQALAVIRGAEARAKNGAGSTVLDSLAAKSPLLLAKAEELLRAIDDEAELDLEAGIKACEVYTDSIRRHIKASLIPKLKGIQDAAKGGAKDDAETAKAEAA